MNGSFDIYTLLFLVLAVVIFLRLRSVLGRRTGNERPPQDPYSAPESPQDNPARHQQEDDKVVPLPQSGPQAGKTPGKSYAQRRSEEDLQEHIEKFASKDSPLYHNLAELMKADKDFDPEHFLTGSKTAYEMIVVAFAEGNRKGLKALLSRDVYDGFAEAISAREDRKETVESSFVGINKANILEAEAKDNNILVTVKFVSELITAIRNKDGDVIEGDPQKVSEVTDIWTFSRQINARDPNWKLIATEAAN